MPPQGFSRVISNVLDSCAHMCGIHVCFSGGDLSTTIFRAGRRVRGLWFSSSGIPGRGAIFLRRDAICLGLKTCPWAVLTRMCGICPSDSMTTLENVRNSQASHLIPDTGMKAFFPPSVTVFSPPSDGSWVRTLKQVGTPGENLSGMAQKHCASHSHFCKV